MINPFFDSMIRSRPPPICLLSSGATVFRRRGGVIYVVSETDGSVEDANAWLETTIGEHAVSNPKRYRWSTVFTRTLSAFR